MAQLDNPQITVVGVSDDNSPSSSLTFHYLSLDTDRPGSERRWRRAGRSLHRLRLHSPTPPSRSTDNHYHPSFPTPILRSAQNSLDTFGSSLQASDSPHHPSPTRSGSIHWGEDLMESRDHDHDLPLSHGHVHCRNLHSALPSPGPSTLTRKPVQTQPRPSLAAVTSFFRRTVRCVRRSSSSPSGETDTGSDPTRNDGQKGKYQKRRSAILDNLEERLKAANKLREEAVALHMLYGSGTVANMKDLRAGLPRPLPQDNALFCEVDVVLAQVWRSYERLTNFWKEETRIVTKALKKGRIDPGDFERWSNIHPSLEQSIEFWKNRPPGSNVRTKCSNIVASSSTGDDLGTIASSLSSAIGSLGEALELMSSSASLQYSKLGRSSFEQVYVAFAGNSDLCLSLLRNCADYGEKVFTWCFPSIASPTSSRAGAAHDIRERNTELQPEATGVSAKSMETLEGMGGVRVPVRGLRTHDGPSTGTGTPLAYTSHDPTLTVSRATDNDSPELGHHDYTSEPQGLQSTVGLEDGHRILGHNNILPRHPKECFLHLKWVPLKDKILVLLSIYAIIIVAIVSLALGLFQDFGRTRLPGIPQ